MTTCSISSRYSSKHLLNFWYMWSRISENMLLVIAWKNKYSQLILFLQKKISRIHDIHLQVCSFYKSLKTATKLQHATSLGNWKAKREWKLHNNRFFSVPLWVYYIGLWMIILASDTTPCTCDILWSVLNRFGSFISIPHSGKMSSKSII